MSLLGTSAFPLAEESYDGNFVFVSATKIV
jgi:hypothetical protein